jgi:hypothetical protein
MAFTDDPLTAGTTVVKAVHIAELRAAIAVLRARYALPVFVWTDPTLAAGTSVVKAAHISELRTALDDVYGQLIPSLPLPTYTDPTIVAGQTVSKAAHVQELRNAARAVPVTATSAVQTSSLTGRGAQRNDAGAGTAAAAPAARGGAGGRRR